jgi:hypothetical protein
MGSFSSKWRLSPLLNAVKDAVRVSVARFGANAPLGPDYNAADFRVRIRAFACFDCAKSQPTFIVRDLLGAHKQAWR